MSDHTLSWSDIMPDKPIEVIMHTVYYLGYVRMTIVMMIWCYLTIQPCMMETVDSEGDEEEDN